MPLTQKFNIIFKSNLFKPSKLTFYQALYIHLT